MATVTSAVVITSTREMALVANAIDMEISRLNRLIDEIDENPKGLDARKADLVSQRGEYRALRNACDEARTLNLSAEEN